MHSFLYLSTLIPLSLALPRISPHISKRNTELTNVQLRQDLRNNYYTNYWEQGPAPTPDNPSDIYPCIGPDVHSYPTKDKWLPWETLWTINDPVITTANTVYGGQYNNLMKEVIQDISVESGLDARLILAVIMQESHGNLTAPCTGNGLKDCSLMQLHGSRTFTDADPKQGIRNVIEDGVYGVYNVEPTGDPIWPGFLRILNGLPVGMSNPFAAGVQYNWGSVQGPNLNFAPTGTKARYYASDLAARLSGWNGYSGGCTKSKTQCPNLAFGDRPDC